ncbi:MAG: reverse transcriptase-like protein [Phycisphaerae bacterium]|nr:reverse transcriptase-like protein [Phycisphaerae bacterium]
MVDTITIFTDGGSRGNPGPAAGAYVLVDDSGKTVAGKGVFLGKTTNNVAEYTGMLQGIEAAKTMGYKELKLFSDSDLMVKQITGQYRVKNENLKVIHTRIMELLDGFNKWQIEHVYRDNNKDADKLANDSMDKKRDVVLNTGVAAVKAKGGKKPLRLGVLLSGGGTTMVNIQKEIEAGRLNAEIVVVISSLSTVRGVELAKKMGLKLEIVRKKDFDGVDSFSARIEDIITEANVDLVVQAGWLCLWKIPDAFENRVMNIHPALLPSFGGQGMWGHHVHEAVVKQGCKVSGCTVHFCTNEYDKGPIIVQKGCSINDQDDADAVAAKVFNQECIAYPDAIRLFSEGRLTVVDGIVKVKPL